MRRRLLIGVLVFVLLVFATGWLFVSPAPSVSRCQFQATVLSSTNDALGARQVTLRIVNMGSRSGDLFPVYGVEAQPPKVDPTMMGTLSSRMTRLGPGEACTNTIALPVMPGRAWRVFFRYFEVRAPLRDFGHYWLMQARLAKRQESGLLMYTDWVNDAGGIQPDGAANGNQPIRSEANSTSSAAGSRR